ncbi:O-methyltransferase [Niabella terrae]
MELIAEQLNRFAELYSSPQDKLLEEIQTYTYSSHAEPHMLSGHVQGRLLSMISHMVRPRRILELGTFTGFSALCLAEGLCDDGVLHTIEYREETAAVAQGFINKSAYADRIQQHIGNALEIIPKLQESWDLVFIDADKPGYIAYIDLILPAVRKNGFILADNIFFHGKALEENPSGKSAKAIVAFNQYIQQRDDLEKLVLTIRDGLYVLRKK